MSSTKLSMRPINWLILAYPLLSGCAFVLEYPMTSASVGVWGTTGKGPTDHAVSYALNEDCETLRAINSEPICKKTNDVSPEVVDKSFNLANPSDRIPVQTKRTLSINTKILQKENKFPIKKTKHKAIKKHTKLK